MVLKTITKSTRVVSSTKALLLSGLLGGTQLSAFAQTYHAGDFRSAADGAVTTPGTWEQYNGAEWLTASSAPGPASKVFVRHTISNANSANLSSVTILSGGTFTVENPVTVTGGLAVRQGGTLQVNNELAIAAGGNFAVASGGKAILNHTYTTPESTIWAGTENFEAGSEFVIRNWGPGSALVPSNPALTATATNGYAAVFGNLTFDLVPGVANLLICGSGVTQNLAAGRVLIQNTSAHSTINMASAGTLSTGINGDLILSAGHAGIFNLSGNGNQNIAIGGNYGQAGGTVNFSSSTVSGSAATTRINGNLQIEGGTADLHNGSGSATTSTVIIGGDLAVLSAGALVNSNAAGAAGASAAVSLNLAGITAQLITIEPDLTNIPIRINAGATAKLARHLTINGSAMFTIVQNGGELDFNGHNYYGTSAFRQDLGATLKITSPEGISETGPAGNVQSSIRTFNSGGIYHYTGTTAQITGTGLNPASGAKIIIIDNPAKVSLSRSVNISNSSSAGIDIRRGIFEGTADAYVVMPVSNNIFLKMAGNTVYRFLATTPAMGSNHVFPQANGIYSLDAGSTLELAGEGPQLLRGTTKIFGNITFSGSGTKNLAGNVANIEGTVTVHEGVTLDVEANTLGKTVTNFSMTGGRFRTSRTSGVQPMMGGTYTLTGGVVEFYGTTAGSTQSMRGAKDYYSIEISSSEANTTSNNLSLASGSVGVKGEFRMKAPAVFQIGGGSSYITGEGSFVMEEGTTLKYGNANGITLESCGTDPACGNIRTATRNFPSAAGYGFIGTATMVSGNGLPATVENLYLQKGGNTQRVTLSQPLTISGEAVIEKGILAIDNTRLTLNGTVTGASTGTLRGTSTSELAIGGTGELGTLYFAAGGQTVGTLVLNRAGNGFANLGTPLTIASLVAFNNGKLRTQTGAGLIFAEKATYSGLETSSPAGSPSYVAGPVTKKGKDSFVFPIGDDVFFAPASISAPATVSESFTAQYFGSNPANDLGGATTHDLGQLLENEYWKIDRAGTSAVELTLYWNVARSTNISNTANLGMARFGQAAEGEIWHATEQAGTHILSPELAAVSSHPASFGYFALTAPYGETNPNVLPVSLMFFRAQMNGQAAEVSWATASETDNSYFGIERSHDGRVYQPVGTVAGAGFSEQRRDYTFTDKAPLPGTSYYRLTQTDLSGTKTVFQPVAVKNTSSQLATARVYPNPATDKITVQFSTALTGAVNLRLLDVKGSVKWQKSLSGAAPLGNAEIPVQHLTPGLYLLEISSQTGVHIIKVQKY